MISPTGPNRRSSKALMPAVVPWTKKSTFEPESTAWSITCNTPVASSPGVVSALLVTMSPFGDAATRSVNVPPMSTATAVSPPILDINDP